MLDDRARILFKTLVERYIADGQPVGSRVLSRVSGLEISPATIRNVMADLEEAGLVASPHTSAGRIPTAKGYRLFVDSLLRVKPMEQQQLTALEGAMQPAHPQHLIATASQLLSGLTHFAGVVLAPRRPSLNIRHVEFLSLSDKRVLLILVMADGDVQNRVLFTNKIYHASELTTAANFLNENFCAGRDFAQIRQALRAEMQQLQGDIAALMYSALDVGDATLEDNNNRYVISGEKNLLSVDEFSGNMQRLRELFDLFEQRVELMSLLDLSQRAEGVKLFIGGESGIDTLDKCSVITAPYEVGGQVVGAVGVIGPTRMAYEQVIPIVDITAKLLSSALSYANDN